MKPILNALSFLVIAAGIALGGADASAGKAVYDKSCKSCHGADGTPNPAIAKMMKVEMKALGSAEVQACSDADLKKAVTDGYGKMKPVKTLVGKDLDNMIAYMRTLKK